MCFYTKSIASVTLSMLLSSVDQSQGKRTAQQINMGRFKLASNHGACSMKKYYQLFNIKNGLNFLIKDNWSGEEALAAYQLLDDLRFEILDCYSSQIRQYIDENPETTLFFDFDRVIDPDDDCELPF